MSRSPRFGAAERRVLAGHRTPEAVQHWIRGLRYNWERDGRTLRSFRLVVRHRSAHCLEGALAAAVILERRGYPPLLLDMESEDRLDHVVFAFRRRDRWGAVGTSRDAGLHGRRPVYRSVEALVRSYYEPYVSLEARIAAWALVDLSRRPELCRYDWRLSERNVWRVERLLLEVPHRPLATSDRRYIRLRERYRAFLERHDSSDTPFTRGRRHWM